MNKKEYPPGTIVFAKLRGYPWWPARIEDDSKIPAKVLEQKLAKNKNSLWTVYFFGSKDYGFFGPDAIRPFQPEIVERDLKAKKFKTKELEQAVRQALNPSLLEQDTDDNNDDDDDEEEEKEEEEEEAEEIHDSNKKPKRKAAQRRKTTANIKSKRSTSGRSVTSKQDEQDEQANVGKVTAATKRRSRIPDDDDDNDNVETNNDTDSHRNKRRKSLSVDQKDHPSPDLSSTERTEPSNTKTEVALEHTIEYKKIYALRHRLQKLVYGRKPGEIPKEDYPLIVKLLEEVRLAPMTPILLRKTKIGKVVKAASQYQYEQDAAFTIPEKCYKLMEMWRTAFFQPQTENAATSENRDKAEDKVMEAKPELTAEIVNDATATNKGVPHATGVSDVGNVVLGTHLAQGESERAGVSAK